MSKLTLKDQYKFPLDLTGKRRANRVEGEVRYLMHGVKNRAAVLNHGAFYTDSIVVRDEQDGSKLTKGDDYIPILYYEEPSELSGKEVCTAIVITNEDTSNTVRVDYNCVGGMYSLISSPLVDLIDDVLTDDRPVHWGDLLGKPEAFPPTPHIHELKNIFGFEHIVAELEQIRAAIVNQNLQNYEHRIQQIRRLAADQAKEDLVKELRQGRSRVMLISKIHEASSGG